jgi:gluconate kinase
LADPVAIIREQEGGRAADVFIKSFKDVKTSLIVSVVVDIGSVKVAISTYKRKKREVIRKIKKAAGIVYITDNSGSLTNRE